jgi:hypothetical protein
MKSKDYFENLYSNKLENLEEWTKEEIHSGSHPSSLEMVR